jgi:HAD superfamily hydrolase (TIGR01549 family)
VLALWRLHRHVGMGGDKYVAAVAGDDVERHIGDDVRDEWERQFEKLIDEIAPFVGAHELIAELTRRGHPLVLASSSVEKHIEHFVDLLEARELADAWTTKDDVEQTKPSPDLVQAALAKAGTKDAVMIGDTPWDIEAARRAGIDTIAVRSGGAYSEAELLDAGAISAYESVAELRRDLENTPLS